MNRDLFRVNKLDPNLETFLRSIIKEQQYHEFTDILIEIMLRRQSEFNLPYDRIIAEARNLVRSLPVIQVVPNSKLSNPRWAAQSGPDGIKIGFDSYKYVLDGNPARAEELYETLTHEVYHSIAMHDRGGTGVANRWFKSRGLNELINEAAANRAARNYSSDERRTGIRRTGGYSTLTKFSPMIARCFGLTEREFLAAGTSYTGEYSLLNALTNGIMTNDPRRNEQLSRQSKNIIETMSNQVELLHNIEVPMDNSQKIPDNRKPDYRTGALTGLVNSMIDMAIFRIENNINYPNDRMAEEYAYTYKSITGFVTEILNQYQREGLIQPRQADFIKRESYTRLYSLATRVIGVKEASEAMKRGVDPHSAIELSNLAKTGNLINPFQARRFGFNLPANIYQAVYSMDTTRIHNEVLRQDFGTRYWENRPACEEVVKIFELRSRYLRPQEKQSFFDKVKAFFQRISGKEQKQISAPKHMKGSIQQPSRSSARQAPPVPDILRNRKLYLSRPSELATRSTMNSKPGATYKGPTKYNYVPDLSQIRQEQMERTTRYTQLINTRPEGFGTEDHSRAQGIAVEEIHTDDKSIDKQEDGR